MMPKEKIIFPAPNTQMAAVHVGWLPGVWAQLGIEVPVSYAQMAIDSPNGVTPDRTQLWTDVLSAQDLDRIIKVLRRVRRKVYGNSASRDKVSVFETEDGSVVARGTEDPELARRAYEAHIAQHHVVDAVLPDWSTATRVVIDGRPGLIAS